MKDIPFSQTPIIEMLNRCLGNEKVSYHMPGHNHGTAFSAWLRDNALDIDTTEFFLTDDINYPNSVINHAMELAAKTFGAAKSYFVTTGATSAVHAAIFSQTASGDLIIASHSSHKSLINACRMFGLSVVLADDCEIANAIANYPQAVAVFLTRPNYFGEAADISQICAAAHLHGMPVITDEAHGSHFVCDSGLFPQPALKQGADIVIHSAHKTLPALTQGAFLHISREAVSSGIIDPDDISDALRVVTTSSPSFLIAATLDYARAYIDTYGRVESLNLVNRIKHFKTLLNPIWNNCCMDSSVHAFPRDPFRVVISPVIAGVSVKDFCDQLATAGIFPEARDLYSVIFICKFTNSDTDFALLASTINAMKVNKFDQALFDAASLSFGFAGKFQNKGITEIDNRMLRVPAESCEYVQLVDSAGRISADFCAPYPPGIPLVLPGTLVKKEEVEYICACLDNGIFVNGVLTLTDKFGDTAYYLKCLL